MPIIQTLHIHDLYETTIHITIRACLGVFLRGLTEREEDKGEGRTR